MRYLIYMYVYIYVYYCIYVCIHIYTHILFLHINIPGPSRRSYIPTVLY